MKIDTLNVIAQYNSQYYLQQCLNLLRNFSEMRKQPQFKQKWITTLCQWKMSEMNISNLTIDIKEKKVCGSHFGNIITLNINDYNKMHHPKHFAAISDTLLHELSHIKTKLSNDSLKKDENGKASTQYFPSFSFEKVIYTLQEICQMDYNKAYDIALGMYQLNQNEIIAQTDAKNQLQYLVDEANLQVPNKNSKLLNNVLDYQSKQRELSKRELYPYLSIYNCHQAQINSQLTNYQLNYASNIDSKKENVYQTARELCPCPKGDQLTFDKLIKTGQIKQAMELLNQPNFVNNQKNLQDVLEYQTLDNNIYQTLNHIHPQIIDKHFDSQFTCYAPTVEPMPSYNSDLYSYNQ